MILVVSYLFPFIQISFFLGDSFGDGIALLPFRPMISECAKLIFDGGLPNWSVLFFFAMRTDPSNTLQSSSTKTVAAT